MRPIVLTVLCWVSLVSVAAAQMHDRWLIVASSPSEDVDWVEPAAAQVRGVLVDQGVEVWSLHRAVERFEAEASAPPAELSESELERWMSLSGSAVHHLADGDYAKALEKLNPAQAMSRNAIEALNRDPTRARRVFDTCLYVVRAVLATESESKATAIARECRQLVPRAEPSPYMHPPAVTELLGQIDALQAKQTGALRVESVPSECAARLNGVLLGETPVSIGELFPGKYRVQVECDPSQRGRVHLVTVGAGQTEHRVDSRFDDTVRSRPTLSLRYGDAADEMRHRVTDARQVAKGVPSGGVVVLSMPVADTMDLEFIDMVVPDSSNPAALAKVSVRRGVASESDLAAAVRALAEGRCMDFTSPRPVELACPADTSTVTEPAVGPAGRRPRGQFIAGVTLASVGLAGLAAGYVLLAPRAAAAEDWVFAVDNGMEGKAAQQKWIDLGGGIIVSSSVGSAALVSAMPLALPEREKTPWWAWASGGAGVGLAAFSIAWGITAESEPSSSCTTATLDPSVARACVKRGEHTSVAVLTGLTAAPLLTMPLVYLLRPSRAKLEPSVDVGRSGAHFALRGRF